MSIAIRDFQADDAAGVSALFRAIYGEHYVYPDVYLPSMIRRHNTAGRWHSAVAVSGGRVLGHAALWRDPHCPGSAELALNVVHPDARGQGLATALGRHLRAQGVALGLSMLTIKQVSSHGQSQRLAKTLASTPPACCWTTWPRRLASRSRKASCWSPAAAKPTDSGAELAGGVAEWLTPLSRAFGSVPPPAQGPGGGLSIASHGRRLEVGMEEISGGRLREVAALPAGRLVYVRLALGPDARARRPHCNRPASFAAAWCPAGRQLAGAAAARTRPAGTGAELPLGQSSASVESAGGGRCRLRACSKSAALGEVLHGEYQLKVLMYHSYIPLFRSFSPCLALAPETLNRL